jgi:hypothetical protein
LPKLFNPKLGHAVIGGHAEIFAVIGGQRAMLDTAKGVRLCKNRVEHRGEIAWRRIGRLKHLCQGRLAGQRFVALGSAFGKLTL